MKLYLYILTLMLAWTVRLSASETNIIVSPTTIFDTTNVCQPEAAAMETATTNSSSTELPWSFSATANNDLTSNLGKNSKSGASLWRSAGATIFVLGLLLGVNYWLRKRGSKFAGAGRSARLRIVERVSIDHRRGILLIEADDERIVASVSADRIETLAVLPSTTCQRDHTP